MATTEAAACRIIENMQNTNPISGNDLQRALLAAQLLHMNAYRRPMFQVPIQLWDTAPCDASTFQLYSIWGNAAIPKARPCADELTPNEAHVIDELCDILMLAPKGGLMIWYMTDIIPNAKGYRALDIALTQELVDKNLLFRG